MMPTIVIEKNRGGRLPFQIYLLVLVTLAGIPMIFGVSTSAIIEQMGKPESNIWGAFLFIGGASNLIGLYWPKNTITGMFIERSGLIALGGAALIWSVLVVWRLHLAGAFSATLTFGLFLACLAQYKFVNKQIKSIIRVTDD